MRVVRQIASHSKLVSFIRSLERHCGNILRILAYHRIGSPADENGLLDPGNLSASSEKFDQQMKFLSENYQMLSLHDLLNCVEDNKPLPPQAAMVTFDDGYRNFLDVAWPILYRYKIPTVLFLATGYLSPTNRLFWWDRLYQGFHQTRCTKLSVSKLGEFQFENQYERLETFTRIKKMIKPMDHETANSLVDLVLDRLEVVPVTSGLMLSWDDARLLHQQGCFLAAHTRNHSILSRVPRDVAQFEIQASQQDIFQEIGVTWPVFSFPNGLSQDIREDLLPVYHSEGFKLAITSIAGLNIFPHIDLFRLKRIGSNPNFSIHEYQASLTGIYHLYCMFQSLTNTAD